MWEGGLLENYNGAGAESTTQGAIFTSFVQKKTFLKNRNLIQWWYTIQLFLEMRKMLLFSKKDKQLDQIL